MVGAFGFAELMSVMYSKRVEIVRGTVDRVVPRFADIWRYKVTALRSGVIGTFIGIIPGVGEDIGAWASYAAAKRVSKTAGGVRQGLHRRPDRRRDRRQRRRARRAHSRARRSPCPAPRRPPC